MLSALKDLIVLVSTIVALAYSTGQQKWLWQQIAILRHEAVIGAKADWGCPSIFDSTPVDIERKHLEPLLGVERKPSQRLFDSDKKREVPLGQGLLNLS